MFLLQHIINPINQHLIINQKFRNIDHLEVLLPLLEFLRILSKLLMSLQLIYQLILAHIWPIKYFLFRKVKSLSYLMLSLPQPGLMILSKYLILGQTQVLIKVN